MRVAVAGGTGVVGRHVVEQARRRGHAAVVLARSAGIDLRTGMGLEEALAGVEAVVDVTSVRTQTREEARKFFGSVTRHLTTAGAAARVRHHVALSIVGIDEVDTGYYAGKLWQEELVSQGPVPWSLLRATQFHEFSEQALQFVTIGRVSLIPGMLCQPVAAVEVAEALLDLVEAGPSGRVADLAGPQQLRLIDMARRVNKGHGLGRWILPVHLPGAAGRGMRSGALTPATAGPRGRIGFDEWVGR